MKNTLIPNYRRQLFAAISSFAILSQPIFFAGISLFGLTYEGKEEGSEFILFIVAIFILTLSLYVWSILKHPLFSLAECCLWVFIIILFLNHFIWMIIAPSQIEVINEQIIFFIALALPGFFAARIVMVFGLWKELVKFTEMLAVILAVGIISAIIIPLFSGSFISGIAGGSYQSASYFSALIFGILATSSLLLDNEWHYRLFRQKAVKLFELVLMGSLLIAAIVNGGRGAFILLIWYIIIVIYWFFKRWHSSYETLMKIAVLLMVFISGFYGAIQWIWSQPILASGLRRAISFIGWESGMLIDLGQSSSNRDVVYEKSLSAITDAPLLGYGAFTSWDKVIPPHNFFLDLILQFGLPVSVVLVFGLGFWICHRSKLERNASMFLTVLASYPTVILMFSGGYLRSTIFWFVLLAFHSTVFSWKYDLAPKQTDTVSAREGMIQKDHFSKCEQRIG